MGHGIELSVDNATTWKTLFDSGADQINTICWGPLRRLTKRVIYWGDAFEVGGGQNTVVRCSRDGGATIYSEWDFGYVSGPRNFIVALACCVYDPKVAYLILDSGKIYKTINYGEDWDAVVGPISGRSVRALAVHPSDPQVVVIGYSTVFGGTGYIYYSNNGGDTWVQASVSDTNIDLLGATVLSNGTMLVCGAWVYSTWGYNAWVAGVWDAATGVRVHSAPHASGYPATWFHCIDRALVGGTRALVGGHPEREGGVALSKTRGSSFLDNAADLLPAQGYTDNFTTCALSMSGLIAYVSIESSGLWRSEDGMTTWEKVFTFNAGADHRVRGVVIADPVQEDWVWMLTGEDNGTDLNNPKSIHYSEDKGETWEPVINLETPAAYLLFASQFVLGYDRNATNASETVLT